MNTEITFSGLSFRKKLLLAWGVLRGKTLTIDWDSSQGVFFWDNKGRG